MAAKDPSRRGTAFWSVTVWLARGWLLGVAITVWRYHSGASWREALTWIGMFAGGLVVHHVAYLMSLGFIRDSRGELQRVVARNRGHDIYWPTTHIERVVLEQSTRSARRKRLFWLGLVGFPLACQTWRQAHTSDWGLAIPLGYFTALFLVPWAWDAIVEAIYLTGFPLVPGGGAKVLDQPPERPALLAVQQQNAFGGARLADKDEAPTILNPKR